MFKLPAGKTRWVMLALVLVAGLLVFFVLGLRAPQAPAYVALLDEALERTAVVGMPDRVFGKQRERDRRIAVGHAGIGQPAHRHVHPANVGLKIHLLSYFVSWFNYII